MDLLQQALMGSMLWQRQRLKAGEQHAAHTHQTWQLILVLVGEIRMHDGVVIRVGDPPRYVEAGEAHAFEAMTDAEVGSVWGDAEATMAREEERCGD